MEKPLIRKNTTFIYLSGDLSGLISLPDEQVGLPYTGYFFPHKYPRNRATFVNRRFNAYAVWSRERLAALQAVEKGSFATFPLLLQGRKLRLNVQTEVAGEILVEVVGDNTDALGKPLPDRSFSDGDPITGDHLDHIVTWKGEDDLGYESGHPVVLRFLLKAAKFLYWRSFSHYFLTSRRSFLQDES